MVKCITHQIHFHILPKPPHTAKEHRMKTFVVNEILANGDTVERYVDADGFYVDDSGNLLLWIETRTEQRLDGGDVHVAIFPCIHWTSCVAQANLAKTPSIHINTHPEVLSEGDKIARALQDMPLSWG